MKKVKLTYFKSSGKYYTEGVYNSDQEFNFDIYPEVRAWAVGSLTLGHLPGLSSRTWQGYILVEPLDGVPALIDTVLRDIQ